MPVSQALSLFTHLISPNPDLIKLQINMASVYNKASFIDTESKHNFPLGFHSAPVVLNSGLGSGD